MRVTDSPGAVAHHFFRGRRAARWIRGSVATGVLVAAMVGTLDVLPASAANPVSAVSFVGSSQQALVSGTTWTVSFRSSSSGVLAAGNHISITFAAGFTLPANPPVHLTGGFTGSPSSVPFADATSSGDVVTVVLSNTEALADNTLATLTIGNITNPDAGTYPNTSFSVSTTKDTAASPSTNVVISNVTSAVSFAGSSQVAFATGTTWTVSFESGPTGALSPGDHIVVTFPSGFVIPANPLVRLVGGFTGSPSTVPSVDATSFSDVVTITLSNTEALADNRDAVLTIGGITNPGAGTYPNTLFTVATTNETAGSPVSDVVISASTVTFTGSSYAAFASDTTWTITDTSAPAENATDVIGVTFAPQFSVLVNPVVVLGAGFSSCAVSSAVGSANTVTIQLSGVSCSFGSGIPATFSITGITNPAAGTYPNTEFWVATTVQPAVSPAAAVVITGTATPPPTEIYGVDAVGTSIAIAQQEFPTPGSAGAVVLCRSDFFSDCLVGGPLAADVDGPLLITPGSPISSTIDPRVDTEIQSVLAPGGTVYILGGYFALNPNIDITLDAQGYHVVREAGIDEYATAVDVANTEGNPSTVFEATGLSFYDALSAVPAAIERHGSILLTDGPSMPLESYAYLAEHPGLTRYAIGGPLAAAGADTGAYPVYGQDLFGTSAAVAETFFPQAGIFGVATAADFPDALGGGVFMATGGRSGPLLLVNPSAPLPGAIAAYLATLEPGAQGYVFGGPLAVGGDVLAALQAAVG